MRYAKYTTRSSTHKDQSMQQTEAQTLAQELVNQVLPIAIGGAIGLIFLLIYTNWCGLALTIAFVSTLFGAWLVTRPVAVPTNWGPNWRGVQQPTPAVDARRRNILASQNRRIMWYIIGVASLVLGGLLVWSWLHYSFLPPSDFSIPVLVFMMFVCGTAFTVSTCWIAVYLQMRYRK